MNIPDEYWTKEAPTECGPYMMRIDNGEYVADSVVKVIGFHWEASEPRKIVIAGGDITPRPVSRGAKFCRLAPAADVERLKAENEKLRGWVRDAYEEGYWDGHDRKQFDDAINTSEALKRLDGRDEP